jgi:O-antigen/teichoic acid export membrane protein
MLVGIIIARVLGPEKRGYYGLIYMACALIFTVGQLGVGAAITYYTGKKLYDRGRILKFLVFSSLSMGVFFSTVFFFTYDYIADIWTDVPRSLMLIGLISVPFFFFYNFLDRFLLANLKVRQSNFTRVLSGFVFLVLVIVFVWILRGGIKGTVTSYTISFVITSLLAFFLFTREFRPMGKLDLSMTGPFLNYGLRMYLIVIFNFMNYRIGTMLVKHYLTFSDVSYFQIATGFAQRFWYFPNAMSALLFPTLLAIEKGSAKFSAKICRNNLFFMVILATAAIFVTRPLVILLYGKEYEMVSYAFFSIIWGIVIFPFYKFLAVYFATMRLLGIGIFASAVGTIVNVIACIILIPRYGVVGAGIASSISYSTLSIILLLYFRFKTGIGFREVLVPTGEDFRMYVTNAKKAYRKLKGRLKRNKG